MEAHSNYYIKSKDEIDKILIVTDGNPMGVTLTLKDEVSQVQLSLCRQEMIEALEYILTKIKAR